MEPQTKRSPANSGRPRGRFASFPIVRWLTPLVSAVFLFWLSTPARAAEAIELPQEFGPTEWIVIWVAVAAALLGMVYAWWTRQRIRAQDPGSEAMVRVAQAIEAGAMAYLRQQIKMMSLFVIGLFIVLWVAYSNVPEMRDVAYGTAIAFLMGVAASYGAGYIGMKMAVEGNVRTANAALGSFKRALETAFRSGSVAGMATVSLGLLGAAIIFFWFKHEAMKVLIGFGFGGSLAALFMRVGGGIFTKAADVGADLVGKVEQNIPEDDPRNAATIADNVGDNVGDCAGMAADVFESYEVTLVAAIILGVFVNTVPRAGGLQVPSALIMALAMYPLLVRSAGVVGSLIGIFSVRGRDDVADQDPMRPISRGFWIAALSSVVLFGTISYFFFQPGRFVRPDQLGSVPAVALDWWRYFGATLMGILLALVIEKMTAYFTATDKQPVREIADSSRTGPATMILSGFAEGLESSWWGVIAIAVTIFGSIVLFQGDIGLTMYGISLAGLGLLTTTGFILAEDTYGPISDNANGIFEMSGALHEQERLGHFQASRIVARLDAVGNTTKALTKGFAIATAVIAAVSLFSSFKADTKLPGIYADVPVVFIGMLIGGAVPFLFSSFAIRAVSRAAVILVEEVRRQFREIPGIMEGKATPDYSRCVSICTQAAQRELLGPGILGICTPLLVAFGLGLAKPEDGAMALGGFFAGAIITGQLMAVLLSNSGGAWDNAKKLIEAGEYGGKGSDNHKAAVICDTVGDPFKDTAGPALNPLIKVMNLVGLLIAPLAAAGTPLPVPVRAAIAIVAGVALVGAILFSRRKAKVEISAGVGPTPAAATVESAPTSPRMRV
ncbi:MAG: sodium-translocating pyrophosphatase [Armatimonadetes bacterium]|nr:sodium-translocating pyrophosphatase [Armatimonadota bacterium]